jgi:hypothetical protein
MIFFSSILLYGVGCVYQGRGGVEAPYENAWKCQYNIFQNDFDLKY